MPTIKPLIPSLKPRRPRVRKAKEVELVEKHAIAVDLARQGKSYREIGERLGVTAGTAAGYVQAELTDLRQKTELDREALLDLELQRCDAIMSAHWPAATRRNKPDPNSAKIVFDAMTRRAKLLGLDAPTKTDWSGVITAVTPEDAARMSDTDIATRMSALMERTRLLAEKSSLPPVDGVLVADDKVKA